LILAGSADFKTELSQSDMFDSVWLFKRLIVDTNWKLLFFIIPQRLQSKIIKLVDVSYGGENGFNQAIELAAESLQNVKFIQEKKLIGRYFDEISQVCLPICCNIMNELTFVFILF
jgi:peptide chain release factor subunit 1